MKKRPVVIVSIVLVCIAAIAALSLRAWNLGRFHLEKRTVFLMDTLVSVYAVGPKDKVSVPIRLALERMAEVEKKFNALSFSSPIYEFNNNNKPITDPEILKVVELALKISDLSDGAFDITTLPLSQLWGFARKNFRVPRESEISEVLKSVGFRHLILKGGVLTKDSPGTKIDLGGIAKGYAVGEAVKVLKENGVTSAIVDAGGDVYALGKRSGRFWKVGIKDPRGKGVLGYVEVEDLAVMGSGDYERFFIDSGKRYGHIFNPKTGHPTETMQAVTIIYPDPAFADAMAKIPFVLDQERGRDIIESIPGMRAIMVTRDGEITYAGGLEKELKIIQKDRR